MNPDAEYVTADEVAQLFRVSPQTVYRWAAKGILTGIRVERTIRFKRVEVDELLAKAAS